MKQGTAMDEHVDFTAMKDGTREEYELLARLEKPYLSLTADRVLGELKEPVKPHLRATKSRASSMAYNPEPALSAMAQI